MKTVSMHGAKTHLSKQVEKAVPQRTGFLKGQVDIPEDFDEIGAEAIQAAFEGRPEVEDADGPDPKSK